jgi:hypothetical protein
MKRYSVYLFTAVTALLLVSYALVPMQAQEHEKESIPDELRLLLHDVREATTQYHDLETATEGGYGKFQECFKHGETMSMGQHYVNGDLAGDDVVDALQPEALVYEPMSDGTMTLVAFEYIVFADVWDPDDTGREPPTLFGQEFALKETIPDTPPLWALHIWLWTHNPEGLFADYNPLVFCPEDAPSVDMSMQ